MNKLLFKYKRNFTEDIVLVSNNQRDMEKYLLETYGWYSVTFLKDTVEVLEAEYLQPEIATIEWILEV